jgi:pimeloyl-ACP methyl ester carboxylesterase
MVSMAQLAALVPDPVQLPGLGHNAHVEDPAAIWALLADRAAGPGSAVRS